MPYSTDGGCGCGCSGTGAAPALAWYGDPDSPGWPGGGGYPYDPFPYSPFTPGGGGWGFPVPGDYITNRAWYDPIISILGEAGKDLWERVKVWLKVRIGEEAWKNLPPESKEAAVHQAFAELGGSSVPIPLSWIVVAGLGALLVLRRR